MRRLGRCNPATLEPVYCLAAVLNGLGEIALACRHLWVDADKLSASAGATIAAPIVPL